ncbi:patatin-like protein [Kordiimonas marina]|uniref:patatin-like protein n=1 Tax=Kordiimonas marina TaxID=2872312 RepID=UPI001FF3353C|nr:patatin-like protein [Kordiimonas marina]MCJ9428469.1 patatin-like protein [Kordiimonas marina]
MREKELRLALVCYGGASLAVYMNGISNEVLKLVRASRAYHSLTDRQERHRTSFDKVAPERPYSTDTEALYFELLQALGHKLELRVIVDAVSGASAGGINGIFLARALAHDLDLDPLRTMWLHLGDVEELMETGTLAERWSKVYMHPFLWLFSKRIFGRNRPDMETRRKLSRFVRSRWFKPPFSGTRMLTWMLNACENMGKVTDDSSLMPIGHKLELFVSLTNFYGQHRRITLHDPAEILEHQHSVILNFGYRNALGAGITSDFGDDNVAGLGFAARATSSFPGAFPPMRLMDLEERLSARGQVWPKRDEFIAKNFPNLASDRSVLNAMSFIDGGVTNNKPFGAAIQSVYDRPAHREVDRRIVYVDPLPDDPEELLQYRRHDELPGFFRTILSSLAEIPRNEPIYEDLLEIGRQNKAARRLEAVLQSVEVEINELVDENIVLERDWRLDTAMLASWRERAHEVAHQGTGYTYASYVQAKTVRLLERLSQLIVEGAALQGLRVSEGDTFETLKTWAEDKGMLYPEGGRRPTGKDNFLLHVQMFRELDVDYRVRRLRFVIQKLNRFMQHEEAAQEFIQVKALKKSIYEDLEAFKSCWTATVYDPALFTKLVQGPMADADIESFLKSLGEAMRLETLDLDTDEMLSASISGLPNTELRHTLFRAYVGYAFYDIMTLPMNKSFDLLEVDEIRVDRISPLDCQDLYEGAAKHPLLGNQLYNFGAFFSRRARENDYIWGRIHAATRLIDFVLDAAGPGALPDDFDLEGLKKRLYLSILDTEYHHAEQCRDLIATLKAQFSE